MNNPRNRQASASAHRRAVAVLAAGIAAAGSALAQAEEPRHDAGAEKVMPAVRATAPAEPPAKETLRAKTTSIGKGRQELRDVPQSITVITERLMDDRNLDTLKDSLRNSAGVSFQAAEGGEEDIRLRGFSLQSTGDIFIDGMRDPAFYERDSFNWDRLEVLRGSASMLFGRGSTGGAVNQVSKQPMPWTQHEIALTLGSGKYARAAGDFNIKTGDDAGLRVNAMATKADFWGAGVDKRGIAPTLRWGIGTRDEFSAGLYHLQNDNGIHYGLPWLTPGPVNGGDFLWRASAKNYYGMASDYSDTGTTQGTFGHIHRFGAGRELKTQVRLAQYERDQRASAIRFCTQGAANPDCPAPTTSDTFSDATLLTRGTQNKIMQMRTGTLQSDYSGKHRWFGLDHSVQSGVDLAHEDFENFAAALPAGVALVKPRTRVGTPDDGASIDESLRGLAPNRTFDAKAVGVYVQDLVTVAPGWKLLGGVRWDRFEGSFRNVSIAAAPNNPCSVAPATELERTDSLWSKRLGVLLQPTQRQSYHLSYGTSFNTSGDTYQYDAGNVRVAPESSRNLELGAKLDAANGNFTTRLALFRTTKYNERNRDADSVDACNYVLSGQRHAAGAEVDVAGRLARGWEVFLSYAYIPVAKVDSSSGAPGTEAVGSRPGLTPRHSGTVWTTYRLSPKWRVGGGLTARGRDKPVGLAADSPIHAPSFVTADLMAEYVVGHVAIKANVINVTDEHYADFIYRGHYVPGRPRMLQVTVAYRFE